jgi:membrane protein DedA with SNARE-associated domain
MGREHLPWATIVEMSLSYEQGVRLKRAAVRYLKSRRDKKKRYHSRAPGMWWLSSAPPAWVTLAAGEKQTDGHPGQPVGK